MNDDTTVNMFWQGVRLPPLAWACMCSFIERGHRLRVFSYHDLAIPAGAVLADAQGVIERDAGLDAQGTIAEFSDVFRYKLLHKYGGWWADSDVYCLAHELPGEPYAWAEQEPGVTNNAILKFPKDDALCGRLLKLALKRRQKKRKWGALGPDLVTEVVGKRKDLLKSGSTATFYPWNWLESFLIWFPRTKGEVERRAKGALFMHFWDSSLRLMGMDVYRDPPPDSYWAGLIKNCPNRVASDATYYLETERTIRKFVQQYWKAEHWDAYLKCYPDMFLAPHLTAT